jgi:hypothetical protein
MITIEVSYDLTPKIGKILRNGPKKRAKRLDEEFENFQSNFKNYKEKSNSRHRRQASFIKSVIDLNRGNQNYGKNLKMANFQNSLNFLITKKKHKGKIILSRRVSARKQETIRIGRVEKQRAIERARELKKIQIFQNREKVLKGLESYKKHRQRMAEIKLKKKQKYSKIFSSKNFQRKRISYHSQIYR